MIRSLFLITLLVILSGVATHSSAQSPFQDSSPQEDSRKDQSFSVGDFLPGQVKEQGQKIIARIIVWQAQIRQKAGVYARQIREDPWGPAFWSYLGLAFAYGVIHALGPGHGKVFVSTYFLSRKARVSQGILMGGLMSFMHVFSAVVLVFLFYFVSKAGGLGSVDEAGTYLQKISAAMISIVGLIMAWKSVRSIVHDDGGHCSCCSSTADKKSMLSLCMAVGLIPCPGAALILFFSISLDILPAGMLAMLFLASGLALTTTSFALVSLFARNLLARASAKASISPRFYHIPALMGALLITFLGAVLFFNPVI
ncbi:MAG: nickel/cobalt transporter [Desulfonatronovibrio sp.]